METFLLMLAVILVAGVWSARLGNRFGFPVLIGFVAIGVILGPGGFRISPVVPRSMANFVGYIALILILFEGGLHTSVARIRKVWIPALSLATVGVLISSAIMALLAYYLLNLPFFPAALLGVAVSSTDAASVFSILGGQPLRKRLVDVLEVESGTNDPMAFFLTIVLIQWSTHGFGSFWHATWYVIGTFALQMFVGLAVGVGTGYLGSFANQRIKLDTGGLYPTLTLAFAVLSNWWPSREKMRLCSRSRLSLIRGSSIVEWWISHFRQTHFAMRLCEATKLSFRVVQPASKV